MIIMVDVREEFEHLDLEKMRMSDSKSPARKPRTPDQKAKKAKKKLFVDADGIHLPGSAPEEPTDEPDALAVYRKTTAQAGMTLTNSKRSTLESTSDRGLLLRRIFRAMDSDCDGSVDFAEVTRIIGMAHTSGSTGRLATPRGGQPSSRVRPSAAVALQLPETFGVDVWVAEMARLASAMDEEEFEANVLGMFDCFREDEVAGTGANDDVAPAPSFLDSLTMVIAHADERAAGRALAVCKAWRLAISRDKDYWRAMCEALCQKRLLYLPDGPCPHTDGWAAHFQRLWEQRGMWVAMDADGADGSGGGAPAGGTFNVNVLVRFRPPVATAGGREVASEADEQGSQIVMPLHQKVAMVRAKRNCSHAQAMRIVMRQEQKANARRGGAAAATSDSSEEVTVVARERPSDSARLAQAAIQERREAALIAAQGTYASTWANNLAKAKKSEPSGAYAAEGEGAAAVDTVARITNPTHVIAFTGMPAATGEAEVRAFFGVAQQASDLIAVHMQRQATGAAEASAVSGFLEWSSGAAASACAAMDGHAASGDPVGGDRVEVFPTTVEHMRASLDGSVPISREEASGAVRRAEGERLSKIRAAREARAAEKERHRADAAALKAANEEAAREKRVAERAAEAAARREAQEAMTPAQVEEAEAHTAANRHTEKAAIISINPEKTQVR